MPRFKLLKFPEEFKELSEKKRSGELWVIQSLRI
jgi:hypothetical protein